MQQIDINLMPWRSWRRVNSGRRYFSLLLGLTFFSGSVAVYYYQKLRSDVFALQAEQQQWCFDPKARKLSSEIERVMALNKSVCKLMRSIEKNIPAGVALKNITFQEQRLYLCGVAASEGEIKVFLSLFDAAHLLSMAALNGGIEFTMEVVVA